MNQLYPNAREEFLTGGIDWVSDSIAVALYNAGGTFSESNVHLGDVGGVQVSAGSSLANKSATDGYADADDYLYVGLTSVDTVVYAIMYRTSDNLLIAHMDTVDGFPFTPSGDTYVLKGSMLGGAFFRI